MTPQQQIQLDNEPEPIYEVFTPSERQVKDCTQALIKGHTLKFWGMHLDHDCIVELMNEDSSFCTDYFELRLKNDALAQTIFNAKVMEIAVTLVREYMRECNEMPSIVRGEL